MPAAKIAESLLLPEQRLLDAKQVKKGIVAYHTEKTSEVEVCPKCATPSRTVYDRRWVKVKDEPVRRRNVILHIRKRRFLCKPCGRPFTEPVPGVPKGARTTARYRKAVLNACERYADLTTVQRYLRCSAGFLYKTLYAELERRLRMRTYPWPEVIGIDEHFFRRNRAFRACVTVIVDMKGKRVFEVAEGKRGAEIEAQLADIPGRDNVRWVVLDLADSYKSFCRRFFPNAELVADKLAHGIERVDPVVVLGVGLRTRYTGASLQPADLHRLGQHRAEQAEHVVDRVGRLTVRCKLGAKAINGGRVDLLELTPPKAGRRWQRRIDWSSFGLRLWTVRCSSQ